jgi:hypothetical protein
MYSQNAKRTKPYHTERKTETTTSHIFLQGGGGAETSNAFVLKSSVVLDCTMLSSRLFQSIAVITKKEFLYCSDLASGTFTLLLLIRDCLVTIGILQRTHTDTY